MAKDAQKQNLIKAKDVRLVPQQPWLRISFVQNAGASVLQTTHCEVCNVLASESSLLFVFQVQKTGKLFSACEQKEKTI